MKLKILLGLVGFAAVVSQPAWADFKVRATAANTNFSLEYINGPAGYANNDVKASLQTVGLGATLISDNGLYVDFSGSQGNGTSTSTGTLVATIKTRNDAALNFGKAGVFESGRGYSYFVGYKYGKTLGTPDTYLTTGYVVGGGITLLPFDFGGVMGLNMAAARLTTNWSDDAGYSADSDTSGFSVGWSLNYPLDANSTFALDWKSNVYRYTFKDCKNSGFNCQVSEVSRTLGLNFIHQF